jgi:hypothetical protein
MVGYKVLGAWGLANIAAGGIGYFNAQQDEWKYFHGMNAAWGVMNTFIAAAGLNRARRQLHQPVDDQQAYKRYRNDKRHYLINTCFDVLYVGVGVGFVKYADHPGANRDLFTGFGRSIVVQGVFLLLFDNVMYASQLKANHRWLRVMDEIRFTNTGVGFNYNF